jgi:hypothetical protein
VTETSHAWRAILGVVVLVALVVAAVVRWRLRKMSPPPAFMDAWVRGPRVPRDVEAAQGYVALGRVYAGVACATLTASFAAWLELAQAPWKVAGSVLATVVVFMPARWLANGFVYADRPAAAFRSMRWLDLSPERLAHAVLLGALALVRRERSGPGFVAELERLERELARADPRGPIGVVTHALLRALRGDTESAAALFALIEGWPQRTTDRFARRVALRWLLGDAARRGDFAAIARRMAGRWPLPWRTPLACYALGRRAARLAALPGAGTGARPGATQDALTSALHAHRAWLAGALHHGPAAQREALLAAAVAWDGVRADDAAHARVLEQAQRDLAETAESRGLPLAELAAQSPMLARCHDATCDRLLLDLEARCQRLRARVRERRALPVIDEWLEWAVLRRALEHAYFIGGRRVRDAIYARLYSDVTAYAVWLYNSRSLHQLSHGIFRHLLAEARLRNDPAGIELQANNVRVKPGG